MPGPGFSLDGYALVTGAASGIGQAAAIAYALEGCAGVAFCDLNSAAAQKTADAAKAVATNPNYRGIVIDVNITSRESVQRMIDTFVREFGRLDYAVNCAGVYGQMLAPASLIPDSEFNRIQQVNVTGTLYCMQAQVEQMKKQEPKPNPYNSKRLPERGNIVTVASVTSWVTGPFAMAYSTSKHAVSGMIKAFAVDHTADFIRVNGVYPAWVNTPMLHTAEAAMPPEIQMANRMRAMIPSNEIAEPEEVADAMLFLSSPRASYLQGAAISVDGGGMLWPANHHDF